MKIILREFVIPAVILISVFSSHLTLAHEAGDIFLRVGAITVEPDEDSSFVTLDGTAFPDSTSGVGVANSTQVGLTGVYMLKDNWGIELLAATPFKHDITGTGSLAGIDIADAKQLPPTLSLQYYPAASGSSIQPYVGIGLNYTIFFSESTDSELEAVTGDASLELDDSVGLALQAGIDFQLSDKWLLNAAVWKIDIDTEATIKSVAGRIKVDVDVDPWVYIISLGYKF